jgi:hypothetical protein
MGNNFASEKNVQIKGLLDPGGMLRLIWRVIRRRSNLRSCSSHQDAPLRTLLPTSSVHHQMIWPWKRFRTLWHSIAAAPGRNRSIYKLLMVLRI